MLIIFLMDFIGWFVKCQKMVQKRFITIYLSDQQSKTLIFEFNIIED